MLEHSGTCNRSLFGHMADDKIEIPSPFASRSKTPVDSRTCDTLPGAALTASLYIVWMES